ncbi:hypothetical protein LPJ73_000357 [Coemansia sp. RSA 2703]|nr:hypothetical protein LPJ73_000357 [Coemansia sp. RSA 2703]KAJ2397547.1 hypothetical protein GGI05_000592 [Coemansia sp. RSA 2603]
MSLNKRIVGGKEAGDYEFPFVADIQYTRDRISLQCVGTIIHEQVIVVPAFCVVHLGTTRVVDFRDLIVGYGSAERSKQQHARVVTIVVNPEFRAKEMTNDIALLQVEPLNLTLPNADRIPIYTGSVHPGQKLEVMGWGNDKATGGKWSERLLSTDVVIGKSEVCSQSSNYNGDEGRVLCTDNSLNPGHDICDGEFGASLVTKVDGKYQLVGTYSYHTDSSAEGYNQCAKNSSLAFYTHVYSYLGFIASTANVPADTFTSPSLEQGSSKSGMSKVALISIIAGSVAAAIILVAAIIFLVWRKKRSHLREWNGHTYELAPRSSTFVSGNDGYSDSDSESIHSERGATSRLVAEIVDITH